VSANALDPPTTMPLPRGASRRRLANLAPPALALSMSLAFSSRPSLWRDETASVSAATRPWHDLVRMLGNVDAVHGLYYVLLHPVASVSLAEWWLRLPSALAVAGTAALLVVLGRQLAHLRTGVVAATLWALLPISSRYGQEARSTALGVMVTVAATVVLVEALRRAAVVWWVAYGVLLAFGGYVFLFSLLVVAGHGVVVLVTRGSTRRAVWSFTAAVVGAAIVVSPLVLLSRMQLAGQLGWMTARPSVHDLPRLSWSLWFANRDLGLLLWVLVAAGIVAALVGSIRARSVRRSALLATALAPAGLPPALLLITSSFKPVFLDRYVAGGAAFVTLLAAYGVSRVRGRVGLAAVTLTILAVAVLALPQWRADRNQGGHGDDVRGVASVIAAAREPGDAIVWSPPLTRAFATAYPAGFADLDDVALATSPNDSGTLSGTDLSGPVTAGHLSHVRRVWLIRLGHREPVAEPQQLTGAGFRPVKSWPEDGTTVELMTRP